MIRGDPMSGRRLPFGLLGSHERRNSASSPQHWFRVADDATAVGRWAVRLETLLLAG
jgi:hypothetical protein